MGKPTTIRVLIYVAVTVVGCLVFFVLRNTATSSNEKLDELVNAVKKMRSEGVNIEDIHETDAKKPTGSDVKIETKNKKPSSDNFLITDYMEAASLLKWDWEKPPEYHCKNQSSAGIYKICQDPFYRIKPPCIAYSFGVYTEWAFEETLGSMGCETHSFDPSVKWGDHIHRKGNVSFHKMGIGAKDTDEYLETRRDIFIKKDQIWKMRTLPTIMKMLGHEGKVIDVLKVDVEGYEWVMLKQLLDSGIIHKVRQFAIEWHLIRNFPKKDSYMDLLRLYYRMKEAGYETFYNDLKFKGYSVARWRIQADALYVNTKFKHN